MPVLQHQCLLFLLLFCNQCQGYCHCSGLLESADVTLSNIDAWCLHRHGALVSIQVSLVLHTPTPTSGLFIYTLLRITVCVCVWWHSDICLFSFSFLFCRKRNPGEVYFYYSNQLSVFSYVETTITSSSFSVKSRSWLYVYWCIS